MSKTSSRTPGLQRPYDALKRSAADCGARPFLEVLPVTADAYRIDSGSYSYIDTLAHVRALQDWYAASGVGHGHRVGLMLQNRPAFFFHWFALNALGASAVPLNMDWRLGELQYVIGHSEICMAIAPEDRLAPLCEAAQLADRALIVTTDARSNQPGGKPLERVAQPAPKATQLVDAGTECALLYTSGTTGRPKGCILPNEYFMQAGQWYANVGGLCDVRVGVERMLTPLPTAHMNAMAYSTMCMLMTGGCLIALDRFHSRTWWHSVRASCATIVHYLGVMPAMLLEAPNDPQDRNHSVRFGFGAGVNPRHHACFEERFGFPLLEAWAMTETGAGAVVIANREPRQVGTSCFGAPQGTIEYRIVDDEEKDAPAGTAGELLVRSAGARADYGFFAGYLKDEAATREAWRGGYFHTGDVVRQDAEGYLHFVDRRKNVIRRSGENISAVEVEAVLSQHPAVSAVGITAVPDALRGDEVLACVVLHEPAAADSSAKLAEELVRHTLGLLAYYKAPGYVVFCTQLPLTATEKIQRGLLRELALQSLEGGSAIDTRSLKKREAHS